VDNRLINILKDVATYCALEDQKALKAEAQKICDKYLGTGTSPAVLNIPPVMVKQITSDLKKPSKSLFEHAKMDIEQLLKTNFVSYANN